MPMSDDAFASLVAEEVKGKVSAEQVAYLELPENWNRWHDTLEALSRNLQDQLVRHDERSEYDAGRYEAMGSDGVILLTEHQANSETKRKKIARFKGFVDRKLADVLRRIEMRDGIERPSEREGIVEFLTQAIDKHRDLMAQYDIDHTVIDEALWVALEGRWEFDKITAEQLDAED